MKNKKILNPKCPNYFIKEIKVIFFNFRKHYTIFILDFI